MAQTGLQPAANHGDGGRNRAVLADGVLHQQGSLHIFGVGHAVGDDGALQRHDRLALIKCFFYFVRNI